MFFQHCCKEYSPLVHCIYIKRIDEKSSKVKRESLGNKEPESQYPVKSLHEFLFDVERELKRFRRIAVLGVIAASFILLVLGRFIFFLFYFYGIPREGILRGGIPFPFLSDLILVVLALGFLSYSLYALFGQSAFFKRWGKRFEQLHTLEQKLLEEPS